MELIFVVGPSHVVLPYPCGEVKVLNFTASNGILTKRPPKSGTLYLHLKTRYHHACTFCCSTKHRSDAAGSNFMEKSPGFKSNTWLPGPYQANLGSPRLFGLPVAANCIT